MSWDHALRSAMRSAYLAEDAHCLNALRKGTALDDALRAHTVARAVGLVKELRSATSPGLMEAFLAEYGLSTKEGIALMCLAEALLRVPDAVTIDALIEDKIAPSAWGAHLGKASSSLVNASTWALMLTGKVLKEDEETGLASVLQGAVKRLGEPVIRAAVRRAIEEMGHQFVLGETIEDALARGKKKGRQGFTHSFDMLGEAAMTARDAETFLHSYQDAIDKLATAATGADIRENPGISIKLSALHPRYEDPQRERVMAELVPRVLDLARRSKAAGIGMNIDAEEMDRLELSLDVIEAVLAEPGLTGWDGFGVVVQAYGKRAPHVIEWLYRLADRLDRKLMVRLVKGAYWDTEIKRAQVDGLSGYPVFSRKVATDVSYILCAEKLLGMTDRLYPQFATHNAHSVAAILELAKANPMVSPALYEFQRLHGMGESLHDSVLKSEKTRCRIYAPVGAHRDLLAYLVRRLLENGANSSFVNQIVDPTVPPEVVVADPFERLDVSLRDNVPPVPLPKDLFAPERHNARGWNVMERSDLSALQQDRAPFAATQWTSEGPGEAVSITNPAKPDDRVGEAVFAGQADASAALASANQWNASSAERAAILNRAADAYEAHHGAFFALLAREAGKTLRDAVAELREAVDFLRYYAARAEAEDLDAPVGRVTCISPWNFPLAIFTGQISAALATGNAVLAKPAEATPLVAAEAVRLLHEVGVPKDALVLVPGEGGAVGPILTGSAKVDGVAFTGSTETARRINRAMAEGAAPHAGLIAETGGLNAMIVDSTALPEQAVRDIVISAFQSAGQRCSALRMLYLQKDIAGPFLETLFGAMDELVVGDPWEIRTDVGPVIDASAKAGIDAHIAAAEQEGRLLKQLAAPDTGTFVGPAVLQVSGIAELEREVFGPVLHVATFEADELDAVIDAINATGYGLTFGLHSRIDDRVERISARVRVGNTYINRNQIGAIVGSQPFGGEGLSGTGPKAGGPRYLKRFMRGNVPELPEAAGRRVSAVQVSDALARLGADGGALLALETLPGPTGESNRLSTFGRGRVLCLGPSLDVARRQAQIARAQGCQPLIVAPGAQAAEGIDGVLPPEHVGAVEGAEVVAFWAEAGPLRTAKISLAARGGALAILSTGEDLAERCLMERHLCIDTTAAGGNATLLAASA